MMNLQTVDLAVDFGGTRVKLGVVQGSQVLASATLNIAPNAELAATLLEVERELLCVMKRLGLSPANCRGLGVGFPAMLNRKTCRVLDAYGKYPDAVGVDLRGWAQARLRLPLAVENDARLALIGEWQHGGGRGSNYCAMITLGTGIGSAVIFDGRPLRGPHGMAGNLAGHMGAVLEGRSCVCGLRGCVEAEAGSRVLPDLCRATPAFDRSPLAHEPRIDFRAVFQHALKGDPCATAVRNRCLRMWGRLCVDLVRAFDVDRIVVGGGVMVNGSEILPALQGDVNAANRIPNHSVRVCAAELGDHMALLGVPWLLDEALE